MSARKLSAVLNRVADNHHGAHGLSQQVFSEKEIILLASNVSNLVVAATSNAAKHTEAGKTRAP